MHFEGPQRSKGTKGLRFEDTVRVDFLSPHLQEPVEEIPTRGVLASLEKGIPAIA